MYNTGWCKRTIFSAAQYSVTSLHMNTHLSSLCRNSKWSFYARTHPSCHSAQTDPQSNSFQTPCGFLALRQQPQPSHTPLSPQGCKREVVLCKSLDVPSQEELAQSCIWKYSDFFKKIALYVFMRLGSGDPSLNPNPDLKCSLHLCCFFCKMGMTSYRVTARIKRGNRCEGHS